MEKSTEYTWEAARKELAEYLVCLGFPEELGERLAETLGSLRAMDLMSAFLYRTEPGTEELIAEEVVWICRKTGGCPNSTPVI